MTVRIGIIGVGQIGKHHLDNYQKIKDVEVVAAADINSSELQRVTALYDIPHTYTDFRELLGRDDLDAVDVALHNNFHMPAAVAALEAGKHVYCEKPMAGSYADAEQMLTAARDTGKKLSIQLASLFTNETKAAKALIDAGRLGRLYHARSTGHRRRNRPYVDGYGSQFFVQRESASGGALLDVGVYHISQVLYLLGNPSVRTITGNVYQETPMNEERRQKSGYDVEELGVGYVRLEGNLTLDIIESWAIHLDKLDGSSIVGSEGGVRLNPFGFFHNSGDLEIDGTVDLDAFHIRTHRLDELAYAYSSPQQHWVAALQGQVELLPTAEIALNTMLISEGIYQSHREGREVTADEVRQSSRSTAAAMSG